MTADEVESIDSDEVRLKILSTVLLFSLFSFVFFVASFFQISWISKLKFPCSHLLQESQIVDIDQLQNHGKFCAFKDLCHL